MTDYERRHLSVEVSELHALDGENPVITGYAALFNSLSGDLGGFREVIRPGAFRDSLARNDDIRALFNHDPNLILGRTINGTLTLSEDERGLKMSLVPADTSYARNLRISIARRDVSQMSFGFRVVKDNQRRDANDTGFLRELLQVDLLDVSPVTFAAYAATDVSTRMLDFIQREKQQDEKPTPIPWRVQIAKRRNDLQKMEITYARPK